MPGGGIRSPGAHFVRRFWRMFPWVFTTQLVYAIWLIGTSRPITSIGELVKMVTDFLPDILLVRAIGVVRNNVTLNGFAWTIHCMLFVEFLMWGFLKFCKRLFLEFIVPASVLVGLGIWVNLDDTSGMTWLGLMNFGTLRTWIAYCVGYECLLLSRRLSALTLRRHEEYILTLLECLGHALIILGIFLNRDGMHYKWLVTYIGFGTLVAVALSGHSVIEQWLCGKVWRRKLCAALGELSLSVYLVQGFVFPVLKYIYPDIQRRYETKPVFLAFLLGSAVLQWLIVPRLVKLFRRLRQLRQRTLIAE